MQNNPPVAFYIKTERSFSPVRKYIWLLAVLIGIGGQFMPLLGLLVPFIMLALMGISLFKGKFWCGNFCPHGSFFDNLLGPISRHAKIPTFLRSHVIIGAVLVFFMFNLGRRFIEVYATLGTGELFERLGLVFSTTYLMVLLVGGFLGVVINERTWCQFCPMGTIQTFFYKLGKATGLANRSDQKVTVSHPDLCHSCGKCARVCPMQLSPYLEFSENYQLDDERCIRCNTCVNNCPAGILQMAPPQEAKVVKENVSLEGFENAQYYQARIKAIEELKSDIRIYTFELLEPDQMPYQPGQFLLVEVLPEIKMYRAYTISGSNEDHSEVSVTIKRLADGYGTNLIFDNFSEGDVLNLKGPMGNELRVDPAGKELLFIANGIGITPFVSSVQNFFDQKTYSFEGKTTLLYGARYEEDLVFDDYLESMAGDNSNFDYYKVLSRPRTNNHPKGYVTEVLKNLELSPETKVYICGTAQMASGATQILIEKGIKEANIFYESFV
ncbi:MAG: FAD-binding oxidoreductase [Bacillota bacterium]